MTTDRAGNRADAIGKRETSGGWQAACTLCPRKCGIPRRADSAHGASAFCGEGAALRLAWAGLHFGEEPLITGAGGSGTVFVTGCNLRCPFCQNWQISRSEMGAPVSCADFASICLALQKAGAENINIVTGSHAIPLIADGLKEARDEGLSIPVLWNSSAYESVDSLRLLEGLVSVWLPDFKTMDSDFATVVFRARDYPKRAAEAVSFMAEASPLEHGLSRDSKAQTLKSGVIMRHLSLPGRLEDTERVLRWYKENLDGRALLSLMTQYTPVHPPSGQANGAAPLPDRFTSEEEYGHLVEMLDTLNIEEGFLQELSPDSEWLPDFSERQPFSSSLAKPVWHWRNGFLR